MCVCVCVGQNQTGTKSNELWGEEGVINHSQDKDDLSLVTVKSQDSRNLPQEPTQRLGGSSMVGFVSVCHTWDGPCSLLSGRDEGQDTLVGIQVWLTAERF